MTRLPTRYGGGGEGLRRARAAALLLLALPGTAFVYQGQELGLEEVELADDERRDPIFFRTRGARKGRDGCRVPVPWGTRPPGFGFTTGTPWLPIPESWTEVCVAAQLNSAGSTLELYRAALAARRTFRSDSFMWLESPPGSLVFARGDNVVCALNVDGELFELPAGRLLLSSEPPDGHTLRAGSAVWLTI